MRVATSTVATTLSSDFDPRFGRCQRFLLIDTDRGSVECVQNPHHSARGGTGTRCARIMIEQRVDAVLTGECGPNAQAALEAAGITMITGCTGWSPNRPAGSSSAEGA